MKSDFQLKNGSPKKVEEGKTPNKKISFSDYEKFMENLEKDGRLEQFESQNPKTRHLQMQKEMAIMEPKIREAQMREGFQVDRNMSRTRTGNTN